MGRTTIIVRDCYQSKSEGEREKRLKDCIVKLIVRKMEQER